MTKEQENEAIAAHHMPIRIKELEAQVASLAKALELERETLLDRFAMAALTGFCVGRKEKVSTFAKEAFDTANAMQGARKQ